MVFVYVKIASQFRLKLIDNGQDIADAYTLQRVLLSASMREWRGLSYLVAECYLLLKDAYDSVGKLRYRLLKRIGIR